MAPCGWSTSADVRHGAPCFEAPMEWRGKMESEARMKSELSCCPRTCAMEHRALKHRWGGGARWGPHHHHHLHHHQQLDHQKCVRHINFIQLRPPRRSHETNPMGQNCGSSLPAKDCTNQPEHPQTQTPATAREHNTRRPASPAIMLRTGFHETKPMGQNCGSPPPAKDRANQPEHPETQTPATAREHNTRRSTSPAVMPQTGLHNTPLSAKRVSQGARPARDGSRQKSQASELLLLLLLTNLAHVLFLRDQSSQSVC